MKKLLLSFAVVLMFGLTTAKAQDPLVDPLPGPTAQTSSQTSVVTSVIKAVVDLSIISGNTAVAFDFDNAEKLSRGIDKNGVFTLQTKSNRPYVVNVKADALNFSGVYEFPGDSQAPLAVSKLSVKAGDNSWVSLSENNQLIIGTATAGVARGVHDYVVNYRLIPGFEVSPATYTTTLTYTISNP